MSLDPERVAECRSWVRQAMSDLGAAGALGAADEPFLGQALFFCQQAAEKALKAFLTWHGRRFRKTHSIEELGRACASLDPGLRSEIDRAVGLTSYAAAYRYPGAESEPTRDEFERARNDARDLTAAVLARLPPEVRP
jgi:HEPN domain-containing protein